MAEFKTAKPPSTLLQWPGIDDAPPLWLGLRECFEGDLNYVEILTWPLPAGITRDRWIIKGIDRAPFYRKVLDGWSRSEKWMPGFQPQNRLPEPLLTLLGKLENSELIQAFSQMRRQGLLLPQRKLSRSTWPKDLSWEGARFCFMDWKKTNPKA